MKAEPHYVTLESVRLTSAGGTLLDADELLALIAAGSVELVSQERQGVYDVDAARLAYA